MIDSPRLHHNSQTVSLTLDSSLIQSVMRRQDPTELVLDYTRTMMGCLLFEPRPASVLMIGLGGGSMLKYLAAYVPESDLTAVEISQDVIDMRNDFCIPPDNERLRIVCADGAAYVRKPPHAYDLILVDGFSGEGIPDALCSPSFYRHCRAALTPRGLLVANVQADTQQTRDIARRIGKAFGGCVISVESDEGGNEIVTAGDPALFEDTSRDFGARWEALAPVHQQTLAVCSTRFERALRQRPTLASQLGSD